MANPVDDPRQQPDGDQPSAQPISALMILFRIAVIFLIAPLLISLAATYLF